MVSHYTFNCGICMISHDAFITSIVRFMDDYLIIVSLYRNGPFLRAFLHSFGQVVVDIWWSPFIVLMLYGWTVCFIIWLVSFTRLLSLDTRWWTCPRLQCWQLRPTSTKQNRLLRSTFLQIRMFHTLLYLVGSWCARWYHLPPLICWHFDILWSDFLQINICSQSHVCI